MQNQSVLYVQNSLEAEPEVLLDPNKLSEDGTVALGGIYFSNNGKYMAYTISRSGSDWQEIYVMDLATGKLLEDHIQWAKFTGASWQGDGFYYSAYDAPVAGKEYSNVNENHKIYYHKLGEPQSKDRLVYRNPAYPQRFYSADVSENEKVLFIYESGAGQGNALYMKDLTKKNAPIVKIADDMDYSYGPLDVSDDRILFITNYGAPKYKITEAKLSSPALKNWKDLIPETDAVLSTAQIIGGKLVVTYEKDASKHAYVHGLDGKLLHEVKLPALGSVSFSGNKEDKEAFYTFTSFTFPASIYRYDIENNSFELYRAPEVKFNPEDYTTEQIFFTSKDGTKVPMFLTYKKGLERNGKNPVLLYGYGGFNISLNPGDRKSVV